MILHLGTFIMVCAYRRRLTILQDWYKVSKEKWLKTAKMNKEEAKRIELEQEALKLEAAAKMLKETRLKEYESIKHKRYMRGVGRIKKHVYASIFLMCLSYL